MDDEFTGEQSVILRADELIVISDSSEANGPEIEEHDKENNAEEQESNAKVDDEDDNEVTNFP